MKRHYLDTNFDGCHFLPAMVSYAQNFEDMTLRRALQVELGFWIDIGAYDPTADSVTRWFSDHGWTGVNVEPNPTYLARLQRARPRDVNLGVTIGGQSSGASLYVIGDTGLTTTWRHLAEQHAPTHPTTSNIRVETLTLDDVCGLYAHDRVIDFLKIDAEGAEDAIILSASFSAHRPRIVLAENTGAERYEMHLLSKDYAYVWFDGLNRWFLRSEDEWRADLIARPPSLWDNFRPHAEMQALATAQEAQREASLAMSEAAAARRDIRCLHASLSWRITRPLRWMQSRAKALGS